MRILIVDDEKSICELIAYILSSEGYEVFKVYDGKEALRRVSKT